MSLFLLLLPCASAGEIGNWTFTSQGMPVYYYTGALPFGPLDDVGNPSNLPADPYFFIGNYRLGLFTHMSGIYQFITAERAWSRINFEEAQPNYGKNDAYISLRKGNKTEKITLVGMNSLAVDPLSTERSFGVGFARYEYNVGNDISCTRIISVKPSVRVNSGIPAFIVSVTLKNKGKSVQELSFTESMLVNFVGMNTQLLAKEKRPLKYPVTFRSDEKEKWVLAEMSTVKNTFLDLPSPEQRYIYDILPPNVFMQLQIQGKKVLSTVKAENGSLTSTVDVFLNPKESITFHVIIGIQDAKNYSTLAAQVADFRQGSDDSHITEGLFARLWKDKLPDLTDEKDEVLRREMLWNAHFVEATAKYSDYYKETFIPQGSVYSYHYGDNISNRDHTQAALAACYTNPELAKSCIRYVMKQTEFDGEIKRGNTGFGYSPATIYKESDGQLYLFNTVAEYLRITKDYAFLDETVVYYPAEDNKTVTVMNLLRKHFIHLRDEIGTGENGLIRLLNSDWADSFLHKYSPNIFCGSAESHLNTTLALAAFPKLIDALQRSGKDAGGEFITALESYRAQLETAYLKDLGQRKFSARVYLNADLRLGVDNVCIEPQGYLLQSSCLPADRKREIYAYVKEKISTPERIGVRNRERPLWGSMTNGEDGGIWYSLEYPLLLGVATFDKEEAWNMLHKFTFHNYTKHFPHYWVGQWTAPDQLNSSFHREGLYAFWIPLDNLRYGLQGYCSHPHTWPLFCYYTLKEQ